MLPTKKWLFSESNSFSPCDYICFVSARRNSGRRAGNIAWMVKCWSCKRDGLSLTLRAKVKSLLNGLVGWTFVIPELGKQRKMDLWHPQAVSIAFSVSSRPFRDVVWGERKKGRKERGKGMIPVFWPLHTRSHLSICTHTHTKLKQNKIKSKASWVWWQCL